MSAEMSISCDELSEGSVPYQLLLVDDDPKQRFLLHEVLSAPQFQVHEASDGSSALRAIREQSFDAILLDKNMPGMNGDEVCQNIRQDMNNKLLPVIIVTGSGSSKDRAQSLSMGATDFIRKPFTPTELIARVESVVTHKRLLDELEHVESIFFSVAKMLETRDWNTGQHGERLAHNAILFGQFLGLERESIKLLGHLGILHDIGKLAIPDRILLKPAELTPPELHVMQLHPVIGAELCSGISALKPMVPLIRHHHENWDGSGYPDGLRGQDIPYLVRVFQLVDIHDALGSERPYRPGKSDDFIAQHLKQESNKGHLQPELVEQFLVFSKKNQHQLKRACIDQAVMQNSSTVKTIRRENTENVVESLLQHTPAPTLVDAEELSSQYNHLNQRLVAILEATSSGIFGLDVQGKVTFVNAASCQMLGYNENELLGSIHHNLVHHSHPDGSPYPLEDCPIHLCLKSGNPTSGNELFFNKDGQAIPVEYTCEPLIEQGLSVGSVVTFQDITERLKAEKDQLLAASVMENTHDAILITDLDHKIIMINSGFQQITGYSQREVLGQTPKLLYTGLQNEEFYQTLWESIQQKGRWQGEILNKTRDGEIFPAWLNINKVEDQQGNVTHYIGSFSDISMLKQSLQQVEHLAYHDALTGLPNRLLLKDRINRSILRAQRNKTRLAILFLDMDRFKAINDSLGHAVGDKLLIKIGEKLQLVIRKADTTARLGGDEFVVLLNDVKNISDIEQVAKKIIHELEKPIHIEATELVLKASIGISLYPENGNSVDQLIRSADDAMLFSKRRKLSEYQFYNNHMSVDSQTRLNLESNLRKAIDTGEFELHYQPQFNLADGRITGAEALVRWNHPDKGMIPPNQFIPLAEESGLIKPLGDWILQNACAQAQQWLDQGFEFGRIAVNISGVQIRSGNMQHVLKQTLNTSGLDPHYLELEITESVIMEQTTKNLDLLKDLKSMGIVLSVDDFGTGYSSLSYLHQLPVDKLKIDRAFVKNLPNNQKDIAIARTVIALGLGLDLKVIAEGVETAAQQKFLSSNGCHEGQGWFFGRPVSGADFTQQFLI